MFERRNCVVFSILIYAFLIYSMFYLKKEKNIYTPCSWEEPCVRFCCNESSSCKEQFIRETFNSSVLSSYYDEDKNRSMNYIILNGVPLCYLEEVPADKTWEMTSYGDVLVAEYFYEEHEYCFKESIDDKKVAWKLLVCNPFNVAAIFYYITSTISVLALIATTAVYAYFKELKTIPGRCFLFFSISILIIAIFQPIFEEGRSVSFDMFVMVMLSAGFLSSFLWMSVLSFDVFWTFLKWQSPSDGVIQLKNYCYFVLGVTFFVVLGILGEIVYFHTFRESLRHFFLTIFILLCLIAVSDVVFLCMTGIQVFRMSKSSTNWEHIRFESEKDRFWTYLQLFGVMLITWPLDMLYHEDVHTRIFVYIIKCFSSLLILAMFVLKKEVRDLLTKSYVRLRT